MLNIRSGVTDVSFYEKALGAKELRRFTNDDGSIHVVEFRVGNVLFHLREENEAKGKNVPAAHNSVTAVIGIFVDNVDEIMNNAEAAGAKITIPATDYEYHMRQGEFVDPFGHVWQVQKFL